MATTKVAGLEKGKFEEPAPPKNRLNWSLYGETKTGKSSFTVAGDSAGPVIIFDADHRLERVVHEWMPKKYIGVHAIKFPKVDPVSRKMDTQVQKEANAEWDRFLAAYDMALQSSLLPEGVARISVDTGTELMDLRLMAEFGRLVGINPRDRGGANAEMIDIMRRPEKYDASVVWTHHVKEEWKNTVDDNGKEKSMTTGKWILDGFKRANAVVQVVAQTTYNEQVKDQRKRFEVTVLRCGVNSMLNNKKFTSADWAVWDEDPAAPPIINYGPLAYISSLIVPETSPEDWR